MAVNSESLISKLAAAALMCLLILGPAYADMIAVCPSGCNYTSITEAIDKVDQGDIIEIQSGTYYENVNVTKQLTLWGVDTGGGKPIVDAGREGSAIILSADGVTVDGFVVTNSWMSGENIWSGIKINSNNNIVTNITARTNENGIWINNSENNTIAENNVSDNNYGIRLDASNNNFIKNNNVTYAEFGIKLVRSGHNILNANNISGSNYGIHILASDRNKIAGNNVSENEFGLNFTASTSNILRNNSIFGNMYNFEGDGANDIDISNLADNRPIYYLVNVSGEVINSSSNASTVYCINCSNITVIDLTPEKNVYGIRLENATNSRMENNTLTNNLYGLEISNSYNISIGNNTVENNRHAGIGLNSTNTSAVMNNSIINNSIGIKLEFSNEIEISGNNISNHSIGIYSEFSNYSEKDNIWTNNNIDQYTPPESINASFEKFPDGDETSSEPDSDKDGDENGATPQTTPKSGGSSRHPYPYPETTVAEEPSAEETAAAAEEVPEEAGTEVTAGSTEEVAEEVVKKDEELIIKLPVGLIAFKSPLEMEEGVKYPFEVRITSDKNINMTFLSEGLEGPGKTLIKDIKVGDRMIPSLEGDKENFKIVPLFDTSIYYTVVGEPYKVWIWEVTPLKSGNHKLLLNIYVAIERPGHEETCDKAIVMSETIDVKVNYLYRIKNLVNTKIELQWIIGALLIPFAIYLLKNRRRK